MKFVSVLPWLLLIAISHYSAAWGKEKVKLTDISTLTLYQGKMTTGRRSSPVPQLHCIGGTAGCAAFVPQVVQCYNRGTDGYDVQWECKTDMDNAFRFGRVDVLCEGYDYPDDPYVLKGSCGMEYTLDVTMEGMKKQQGHNYYGGGQSSWTDNNKPVKTTRMGDLIILVIVLLLMYGLYKTCIRRSQYSPTDDDSYGPDSGFRSSGFGYGAPPPPGFRSDYTSGYDAGCSGTRSHGSGSSGAGNFWSGAVTGGLLGYMFGSRNSGYDQGHRYRSAPTGGDSWGGTSSFGGSSESTGTRTASGFGGTRRR